MQKKQYSDSHLYTIAVRPGGLPVIPEELDRVKKSSAYRILCVLGGECQLFLSGKSYRLRKNDICYLCPGDIYHTTPIHMMKVLNIYFSFDRDDAQKLADVAEIDRSSVVQRYEITDMTLLDAPFVLKNFADGTALAERMPELAKQPGMMQKKRQNVLLEMLLSEMMRHHELLESNNRDNKQARLLAEITNFINGRIREKLTCRMVAEQFGYHPNYLNALVNEAAGMPLRQLIMEQKIKYATDDLMGTDKPIAEIAQDYAFCDSSHFDRCYYRVTGLRPTEVRHASRGEES